MIRPIAVALVVAAAAGHARADAGPRRPRIALVVGAPPALAEPQLAAIRARLSRRYRVTGDGELRRLLEQFERAPRPEDQVQDELDRVHRSLRRLDLDAARRALDDATARAARLPPTETGRKLASELAVREALYFQLAEDEPAALAAMQFALSIDPSLELDPDVHPPPILALLASARAARARAPRIAVRIETDPAAAAVIADGAAIGSSPLTVDRLARGPAAVWLTRDGFNPRLQRIDVVPGAQVRIQLSPLDRADRLRPLIEAVRQTAGERPLAAQALAAALDVDAIAVVEQPGAEPVVYRRDPAPRGRRERRFYDDWLGNALSAAGVAGLAVGGVYLYRSDRHAAAAREATDIGTFEREQQRSDRALVIGVTAAAAGAVLLGGGIARYWLARPRESLPAVSAVPLPGGGLVILELPL